MAETAAVAQLVEYVLGKDGVMGSSPISSFSAREEIFDGLGALCWGARVLVVDLPG